MQTDTTQQNVVESANLWWLMLLQGIAAVIIGWFLLVNPAATTLSLVVFLGLYWLIAGVMDVIFSFFYIGQKGANWGLKFLGGLIGIIAGLFVLNNPIMAGILTPVMLMYIVAFTFVFNGIIKMVVGKTEKESGEHEWSWGSFFVGTFYLIFGIILITGPVLVSTVTLILAVALLAIVGGIGEIVLSFKVKGASKELKKESSAVAAKPAEEVTTSK
jgi:uncharacterized membrane protein HdeD (DUF308 family)